MGSFPLLPPPASYGITAEYLLETFFFFKGSFCYILFMISIMKGVEEKALALRKHIVCWGLRAAQVKNVETMSTWQVVCFPKSVGSVNCLLSL